MNTRPFWTESVVGKRQETKYQCCLLYREETASSLALFFLGILGACLRQLHLEISKLFNAIKIGWENVHKCNVPIMTQTGDRMSKFGQLLNWHL